MAQKPVLHSSPLRSRYDYYYSIPSADKQSSTTQAENFYENNGASLFGEYVPAVTDLLENFDNHLYESLRKNIDNNIQLQSQSSSYSNQLLDNNSTLQKSSSASDSQTSENWNRDDENSTSFRTVSAGADRRNGHCNPDNTFFNATNNQWSNYGKNNSWDDSLHPSSISFSTDVETYHSVSRNVKAKTSIRPKSTVIDVKPFTILSESNFPMSGRNRNQVEENKTAAAFNEILSNPVIIRDTITTGSKHRLQSPRSHKKTSFTIVNELTPSQNTETGRISPFLGRGFKGSRSTSPSSFANLVRSPSPFDQKFHNYLFGNQITRSQSVQGLYRRKRSLDGTNPIPRRSKFKSSAPSFEKLSDEYPLAKRAIISSAKVSGKKTQRNPRQPSRQEFIASTDNSPKRAKHRLKVNISSSLEDITRLDHLFPPSYNKESISNMDLTDVSSLMPTNIDQRTQKSLVNFQKTEKRVSRVTSLSPIIGTPNKSDNSEVIDGNVLQKTPRVTSSMSKMVSMVNNSRKSSAGKFSKEIISRTSSSPTKGSSKGNSKSNSRPASRANFKAELLNEQKSPQKSAKLTGKPPIAPKKQKSSGKMSVMANFSKKISKMKSSSEKMPSKTDNQANESSEKHSSLFKSSSTGALKQKMTKPVNLKKLPSFKLNRRKKDATTSVQESMLKHEIKKPSNDNTKKDISVSANLDNNSVTKLKKSNSTLSKSTSSGTLLSKKESQMSIKSGKSTPAVQRKLEKKSSSKTLIKTDTNGTLMKRGSSKSLLKSDMKDEKTSDSSNIIQQNNENSSDKLIPLTKNNVVSMTTAAITAQPLQIQTTLTNHMPSNQPELVGGNLLLDNMGHEGASAILEKSQKTLENIQKAVNEATDEIHKTINENLSNLKTLEQNIQRTGTDNSLEAAKSQKSLPPTPRILTARNSKLDLKSINESSELTSLNGKTPTKSIKSGNGSFSTKDVERENNNNNNNIVANNNNNITDHKTKSKIHRNDMDENFHNERSSERAILVPAEVENQSGNIDTIESISQSIDNKTQNKHQESFDSDQNTTGCCDKYESIKCCRICCVPCGRKCNLFRSSSSKQKLHKSTQGNNMEKVSCWKRINCCRRNTKKSESTESVLKASASKQMANRSKMSLCFDRLLCCRKTHKVAHGAMGLKHKVEDDEVGTKICCCCFKCERKNTGQVKDSKNKMYSNKFNEDVQPSCCSRIWHTLMCCKKKKIESRRPSMISKKQSLAPTIPLSEDNRPKLDVSLIEHASLMKGAIPILPICLAWFCLVCNVIFPGIGTFLSGCFCLCLGKPRFSQHDTFRSRIGSFVINCIVGVSQLFTIIFCLVGWGWAIWWGFIMIDITKRYKKIKETEMELNDADEDNITVATNQRDIEAGRS